MYKDSNGEKRFRAAGAPTGQTRSNAVEGLRHLRPKFYWYDTL
jgi:hypothetical protein